LRGKRQQIAPQKRADLMLILVAVALVILLVMVVAIAYALVLRELRRINTNLEQFIKLVLDARQREDARQRDVPTTSDAKAPTTRQY
jgi:signal transduction histidine kinase